PKTFIIFIKGLCFVSCQRLMKFHLLIHDVDSKNCCSSYCHQTNSIYSEIHLITAIADGKRVAAVEVLLSITTVEGLVISQSSRSLKSSRMREESRENQSGSAASKNQTPI